jgi:head-tail adaptor
MTIIAGNLRERIDLMRASCSTLPNGEVVETFEVYASVRAQVIQQRSSKALTNGENWYPTARSFRMRMPPKVQGGDRIRYNGELYVAMPPKVYPREGMQEVDCELLQQQEG